MGDNHIIPTPEEDPFPGDAFTDTQRKNGAVILHIVGTLYMMYANAVLCYYFFVPSVLLITKRLKIKHDVAGAIFIAACTSIPGLILNTIEVFHSSPDEVGFGEFVGASVFNILILVAVGSFATKAVLRLNKWPIFRDLFFYIISVILLFVFFVDDSISWYEALILVVVYGMYLMVLIFNDKIEQKLKVCLKISQEPIDTEEDNEQLDQESPISLAFPKGNIGKVLLYIITIPILAPLCLTLPDTRNKEFTIMPSFKVPGNKLFVWTFVGSIIWMQLFGFCFVWWTTTLGQTLGVPAAVMGLTYAAIGVATPIIVTIILVVRKGKGNMAVSTAFGANIFQYTLMNPLPWLLWCIVNNSNIAVSSTGGVCSLTLLVLMIIGFMVTLLAFRWKLRKLLGLILVILFILFVCVSLAFVYDYVKCPV